MPPFGKSNLKEKILQENRRVHALENRLYLERHPEQTNFFQSRLLKKTFDNFDRLLNNLNAHILELGCGTGYLHLPLLARGYHVTGVDLSPEMIGVLKEKIPGNQKPRSRLIVMDVEEFSRTNQDQYDAVVLSALLHHLYDYQMVVRKLCNQLKPGGLFLVFFEPLKQKINTPFRYGLHKGLSKLDDFFYQQEMRARRIALFEDHYQLSDYQRKFGGIDPNRLEEVMKMTGVKVLEISKYCARRYGISAWAANCILGTANTFNLLAKKL